MLEPEALLPFEGINNEEMNPIERLFKHKSKVFLL